MNVIPTLMWSIREASETTGLSMHYIRQAALTGKIPAIRTGTKQSKILVNAQSLMEMLLSSKLTDETDKAETMAGIREIKE